MAAHNNHLLRMLGTANFADHVGGIHRAAGNTILNVDLHAHAFALVKKAAELLLIFSNHADDGDFIVSIESHCAGVGKVHACGKSAALSADDGHGVSVMRFLQEVAKLCKVGWVRRRRSAFFYDQQNLASP